MALPKGPWTPGILALTQWVLDPAGTFERGFREYGDFYSINNPVYGREVIVSHPELIKPILTGDPAVFHAGEANEPIRPLVGDRSILLLDGRAHHRERKLLMPPFHGERLAVYARVMRSAVDRAIADFPEGQPFSLLPHMQRVTMNVILRTVFGLREDRAIGELSALLSSLIERLQSPLGMMWMMPAFQRNVGPLTPWASFQRSLAAADALIASIIEDARASSQRGDDILSLLLAATDEDGKPMSGRELRDELVTLLFAGHETTAISLAWAADAIARRPDVLGRIREEVQGASGAVPGEGPLPYLDATIKEALRLYPIASLLARKVKAPITLNDHDIPEGTYLIPCIYNAHRHPAYWEEPSAFRPERFLGAKIDPHAWIPFGGGARRCIGMTFALFEMRVVLAALVSSLDLTVPAKQPKVVLRSFLFTPEGGARVTVRRRERLAA